MLILTAILVAVGCSVPSFTLKIHGLAGIAVDIGEEGASTRSFSIFEVVAFISSQALPTGASMIGMNSIAIVFVTCAFCVPVSQMFLLAWLWIMPLAHRTQQLFIRTSDALAAWS